MLDLFTTILGKNQRTKVIPLLPLLRVSSHPEYREYLEKHPRNNRARMAFETALIPEEPAEFVVDGYCHVCKDPVDFLVDFQYSYELDGKQMPNWRERLVCPKCHLQNRFRATIHIIEQELPREKNSQIYITEQTTPLYTWFNNRFSGIYGSEHLGDGCELGSCNNAGVRNEDITRLSFPDDMFHYVLSFDVFEHIPDYPAALRECLRCLKPNGTLFFSVPFALSSEKNIVRARASKDGSVEHLLPPEYHGDPLSDDGCLCFYKFGWELLEELNSIGFRDVKALLYWSETYGYLGGEQVIFTARKPL